MSSYSPVLLRRAAQKKLIVFDLDGTLAVSKARADREMASILRELLGKRLVAVIGGGKWGQFEEQLVAALHMPPTLFSRLFLFPTTSTSFYRYAPKKQIWRKVYSKVLTASQVRAIKNAFHEMFQQTGYVHPKKIYGEIIENRGTQVSFSVFGQKAPLKLKTQWFKTKDIRPRLIRALAPLLPQFEVRSGGLTTIDVTQKGIDKAYGIRQIQAHLDIPIRDMIFVGDALYPGGNDYAAKKTGVLCVRVESPEDTKKFLRGILRYTP